eukprot:CAMPEP_0204821236 /NCGR_PEP_ID=MMETSP1018-20131115/5736_1 /ASSEMBLY_ACC=CAM_ASM_000518 /TAXON_ID=46462 /ORGANISM="Anophryoides haemophila, Strain AH6" /LENGTH=50 /DNA_ID=CAMNT_0051923823 /DNA_START=159 /DNA_END=311 /DNA_ORIENTATION=+
MENVNVKIKVLAPGLMVSVMKIVLVGLTKEDLDLEEKEEESTVICELLDN